MTPRVSNDARRDQVIGAVTELFWRKGYDDVSIGDVIEATGMNRYALYQAFGGKKEIFMAVLMAYTEGGLEKMREVLSDPDREPIDAVHEVIVAKMLDPEMFPAGCLMCTTAVDVAAKDADVAQHMMDCNAAFAHEFVKAYERAQERGLAPRDGNPSAFAELAHALYFSVGVQARMGRSREQLLQALAISVDSLRYKTSA